MKFKMKLKMKDIVRYLGLVIILFVFLSSVQKMYERKTIIEGYSDESDSDDDDDDGDDSDDEIEKTKKGKQRIKKLREYIDTKMKADKFKDAYKDSKVIGLRDVAKRGKGKGGMKKLKKEYKDFIYMFPFCGKGLSSVLKGSGGEKIKSMNPFG